MDQKQRTLDTARRTSNRFTGSMPFDAPKAAANDGRIAQLLLLRDRAACGTREATGFSTLLTRALALAAPELRIETVRAQRPLQAPLVPGPARLRDFRVAAAAGGGLRWHSDLIVIEAAAVPGATVLRLRPARASVAFAGVMAPPLEGLCSLSSKPDTGDAALLALALTGHILAQSTVPDMAKDPGAVAVLERLVSRLPPVARERVEADEAAALRAWASAWIALARADHRQLEAAHATLERLASDGRGDFTTREDAQIHANLALVCLALGGTRNASARLRQGLASAQLAAAVICEDDERQMAGEVQALIAELAGALGDRHGDKVMARIARSARLRSIRLTPSAIPRQSVRAQTDATVRPARLHSRLVAAGATITGS